jgi:hypothetical protein
LQQARDRLAPDRFQLNAAASRSFGKRSLRCGLQMTSNPSQLPLVTAINKPLPGAAFF